MVVSLTKFPLWTIAILLHSLGVPMCVVNVGVFLDIGVGIHGGRWGHNLAWRGQQFLADHSSSIFLCYSTGHNFYEHPQDTILWWIIWDDLDVVFQYIWLQNHEFPMIMWLVSIFASNGQTCVYTVGIYVMLSSLFVNNFLLSRTVVGRKQLCLYLHRFFHCAISLLGHIVLWFLLGVIPLIIVCIHLFILVYLGKSI